jgi:hypothetical protein
MFDVVIKPQPIQTGSSEKLKDNMKTKQLIKRRNRLLKQLDRRNEGSHGHFETMRRIAKTEIRINQAVLRAIDRFSPKTRPVNDGNQKDNYEYNKQ